MTKEIALLLLAALLDQVEKDRILVEGYEAVSNDEAGHVTVHWLKLPRPARKKPLDPPSG